LGVGGTLEYLSDLMEIYSVISSLWQRFKALFQVCARYLKHDFKFYARQLKSTKPAHVTNKTRNLAINKLEPFEHKQNLTKYYISHI